MKPGWLEQRRCQRTSIMRGVSQCRTQQQAVVSRSRASHRAWEC
jgi:hypothetical protein